jgi:hypothetical protein
MPARNSPEVAQPGSFDGRGRSSHGLCRDGDGSLAVLENGGGGTGQAHVIIDVNGYFQ